MALTLVARIFVAAVWIVFGVAFKLFRLVPRHERIVARILGDRVAPALTRLIGIGEAFIGAWMLSGRHPVACVAVQTALIVTMNTIEIIRARDLLLAPIPMLLGNTALLTLAWLSVWDPSLPR